MGTTPNEASCQTAVLVDWANRPAALASANPMGKVPVIIHHADSGDHVVTEAAAICHYLAETAGRDLLPTDAERADYFRWFFFAAGPVEQAVVANAMGWQVPPDREGMAGFGNFDRTIDTLDSMLESGDYVCGDRFTMADVYVGSQVDWGLAFNSIPSRPSFEAYAGAARPQYLQGGKSHRHGADRRRAGVAGNSRRHALAAKARTTVVCAAARTTPAQPQSSSVPRACVNSQCRPRLPKCRAALQ
ncbi:MAG: glutathione S-transferase family protein [Sphingomonadaceae bacterium]